MSITMKSPNNLGNYSISDDGLTVNGRSSVFYVESSEPLPVLYFEMKVNGIINGLHIPGFTFGSDNIELTDRFYCRKYSANIYYDTANRLYGINVYKNFMNDLLSDIKFYYWFTNIGLALYMNKFIAYDDGVEVARIEINDPEFQSDFVKYRDQIYVFETFQWQSCSSSITYTFDKNNLDHKDLYNKIAKGKRLFDDSGSIYAL